MLTYEQARDKFARCKNPDKGYQLGSSTVLLKRDEFYVVRLHETDIVTIAESGAYSVNTGGWYTKTTSQKIEEYSPVRFSTDRGLWFTKNGRLVPNHAFTYGDDGEFFYYGGNPLERAQAVENNKVFTRENAKYRKAFVKKFLDGTLGTPNGGDCLLCHVMRQNELGKSVTLGEVSHIWSHLAEQYHVPSLLWAALMERYMATNYSESAPKDIAKAASEDWGRALSMQNGGWIDRVLRRFFHRRRMAMVQTFNKESFEELRSRV